MLYRKDKEKTLAEQFKNPAPCFRAAPFWAWNGALDERVLRRQTQAFYEMGLGGWFMHVRYGLDDRYLGYKFMNMVDVCRKEAEKTGMLAWLYDEDKWPSGAAGGFVTKDARLRCKTLVFRQTLPESCTDTDSGDGSPYIAARYAVETEGATLKKYRRVSAWETLHNGESAYYAVVLTEQASDWWNGNAYADNTSDAATDAFIACTHEAYRARFSDSFGGAVPGIFTDEPHIRPSEAGGVHWSADYPEKFELRYGEDIFARLPELFFDCGRYDFRYRFYDFISERFACCYADKIGGWCARNGLMFVGHYLCEDSIEGQIYCEGDVMRQYRAYDFPGIDMLCDEREYHTVIQAKSVANQYGREGVMSELYGSTNWDFDFRRFKLQGDWQAALGVTLRVPHLAWYSMKGEGKRDYPPSIGIQANWYKKFSRVEEHFARLNVCMTGGRERVRVAVLHPVESGWVCGLAGRRELTARLIGMTHVLLKEQIPFDFLNESIFASLCEKGGFPLHVGKSSYDAVVIPPLNTVRLSTLERLEAFAAAGGKLVYFGGLPALVDGAPSDRAQVLQKIAEQVDDMYAVPKALAYLREVEITATGAQADKENMALADARTDLLYRYCEEGDMRWLFIAHALASDENAPPEDIRIRIQGQWQGKIFDTLTGEVHSAEAERGFGETIFSHRLYAQDSLLLCLMPGEGGCTKKEIKASADILQEGIFPAEVSFCTDEPNVLLLDVAEVCAERPALRFCADEILQQDEKLRKKLGFASRPAKQPWATERGKSVRVSAAFDFECKDVSVKSSLAFETDDVRDVFLNGKKLPLRYTGKYVDEAIDVLPLPPLQEGRNTLRIEYAYNTKSGLEPVYLLGEFGVGKAGNSTVLTTFPDKLGWDRLDGQGFPFYGGNMLYESTVSVHKEGELEICVPHFCGNLIEVFVDGQSRGDIVYAPYICRAGRISAGKHLISCKLYGNRFNTFGQLHNATDVKWDGWYAWRTEGQEWTYSYRTRPCGIMSAPIYRIRKKE